MHLGTPPPSVFQCLYTLFKSLGQTQGGFTSRRGRVKTCLRDPPVTLKGVRKDFFSFASGDDWEFSPSIARGEGVFVGPEIMGHPRAILFSHYVAFLKYITSPYANKRSSFSRKMFGRDNAVDKPVEEETWHPKQLELKFELKLGSYVRIMAPFELRSDEMSKRISLKKLAEKVEKAKGVSSALKSTLSRREWSIREKRPREEASNISLSEVKSKGKEALSPLVAKKTKLVTSSEPTTTKGAKPALALGEGTSSNPGTALGPWASMLGSAAVAEKILSRVILLTDKEKVNKLSLDQNEALAKKKAIEEYKTSEDFHEAVENASSKYFGEGFNFCKRQLARHHPNLGINLDGMGLDHNLLEEEDESEKEEKNKSEESPFSP
ncbi:hypothetical protein Acr_12g0002670 [Actinidia rufa]|uniref:Uncharacterized protein n=1 Tax=Actinidia rufa TaxID=165716 RepID=A0A7J0FH12_9ERIC|nr:hypothetical protein Acr_12g0002670 [Actinidia rufa]